MLLLMKSTLKKIYISCLSLSFILFSATVTAQITVSKSILEFNEGNLIQDVDVVNSADHKIFLKMSIAQILQPESEEPERVELTDPKTAPVLVSPTQLMVLPGQRKRLRLILRKVPKDKDDIYRLSIKPFIGDITLENNGGGKASALKVLLGYDLLLLARPENAAADLQVTRTDRSLTFENRGNTNVLLRRMIQCDAAEENCENLTPNRIYAGEVYTVELPKQGSASQYPVQVWHSQDLESYKKIY